MAVEMYLLKVLKSILMTTLWCLKVQVLQNAKTSLLEIVNYEHIFIPLSLEHKPQEDFITLIFPISTSKLVALCIKKTGTI